ncbi:MAG: DUF6612 family protein [Agathobaculum sp.]|jgi:hypothetical protein|uniref:DUF6612 family protein n=1 Tax=Agathobaculum sp. TaxID=2048138 RepID=UPI003D8C2D6D
MKKKLRLLAATVLVAAGLAVTAGAASFDSCADKLHDIGLFQGTGEGYELDRAPTRAEAATMLVRLLGKETEAKELEYTAPFTDLANWQKPYVQYLYENKLTNGATATTFEPEEKCTAQMYSAFLLRSLGYSEAADAEYHFEYRQAVPYAFSIGLADFACLPQSATQGDKIFLRDHIAAMSLTALHTPVAGKDTLLLEKLVADGAIDKNKAADLLSFFEAYDAYLDASLDVSKATKADMEMSITANMKAGGQKLMDMQMPMSMKMDINTSKMDSSKIAMTGSTKITLDPSMVEQGEPNTMDMPIEYYYTDGYYYMNMGGEKVKMAMSFDDAMAQLGDMTEMQSAEPICLIDAIQTAGGTTTITYSDAGMNGLVESVIGQMGIADPAAQDVAIKMENVKCSAQVKNGKLSAMNVSMTMSVTAEGQTIEMDMTVESKINALGNQVKVTLPSDLNTYQEMVGGADAPAA